MTPARPTVSWIGWAILGLATVLVAATFRDYGISWDEMLQNTYGEKLLNFYASGFQDRSAFTYVNLYLYGGLFDMTAAALNLVSPFGEYETRHLLGGLVFVAGLAGGWRLAELLGGARAGVIALACLACTPLLYGHSFINPKDSPFAWLCLWAAYFGCRILEAPEYMTRRDLIGFGVSLGLALGTRVMALALPAYMGLILALTAWVRAKDLREAAQEAWRFAKPLAPALLLSLLLMAVFWPWSVTAPFNVFGALETFSHFTWQPMVLWSGEMVPSANLPPVYLTRLLLLQLPELVLAGVALALAFTAFALRRGLSFNDPKARQYAFVVLSIAVPLVAFAVIRPVVYNGVRHFLFVVPPLVVLAAIGLDRLLSFAQTRGRVFFTAACALLAAGLVRQVVALAALHPYEYVFYNAFVGGIPGAEKRFELDYWGTSLGEAARGLAAHLDANASANPPKVYVCGDRMSAAYFLPKDVVITEKRPEADYYIGINDPPCRDHFENPVAMISVQREGVTLGYVLDLKKQAGN